MKDHEADDDRLDEKENAIELVVTFIACDCSGHEAGEVKDGAGGVLRCASVCVVCFVQRCVAFGADGGGHHGRG